MCFESDLLKEMVKERLDEVLMSYYCIGYFSAGAKILIFILETE